MKDIPLLGTQQDRQQHVTGRRTDNAERQQKVISALSLIYEHGYAMGYGGIEELLAEESLVPIMVSYLTNSTQVTRLSI